MNKLLGRLTSFIFVVCSPSQKITQLDYKQMVNYSTIPHAAVDSTPLAHDSKATPWRRLVASAVVVSFVIGAIGAVAGAPTPDA